MTDSVPSVYDLRQEREKLEAFLWEQTEWRGSAETMIKVLDAVDRYADLRAGVPELAEVRTTLLMPKSGPVTDPGRLEITDPLSGQRFVWGAPIGPGQVQCRACFRIQEEEEFRRDSTTKSGRLPRCKTCVREKCYVKAGAV